MKTQTKSLSAYWQICLFVCLSAVIVMMPDLAFAQINTTIGNALCTVMRWMTGNAGQGLATLAITIIGVGALLGKVSWGMAIIVGVGIALVFGASQIVTAINAGGTGC